MYRRFFVAFATRKPQMFLTRLIADSRMVLAVGGLLVLAHLPFSAVAGPLSEDPGLHAATFYPLNRFDGSNAGIAVDMLRTSRSDYHFRLFILTPEGDRWHHSLYLDAPTGLQSTYFVDEASGWWVRQEVADGLRSATASDLSAQRMRRSNEAQRIIVHWRFANGLSLEKTIDVPKGDPGTAVPFQAAALRELLGDCASFPPSVLKALQMVKENGTRVAPGLQALNPLAEACGLKKLGRGEERRIHWAVARPKHERVENGLVGRSREILAPFTTIDADRPDATDRLPAGLQLVLGKQIVWPEAEPE